MLSEVCITGNFSHDEEKIAKRPSCHPLLDQSNCCFVYVILEVFVCNALVGRTIHFGDSVMHQSSEKKWQKFQMQLTLWTRRQMHSLSTNFLYRLMARHYHLEFSPQFCWKSLLDLWYERYLQKPSLALCVAVSHVQSYHWSPILQKSHTTSSTFAGHSNS